MLNKNYLFRILAIMLFTLMLSSCAMTSFMSDKSTEAIEQANELAKQGKLAKAAEIYWQQATHLSSPQRQRLRLLALETVLTPETLALAKKYQASLDESRFQGELLVNKRIADARLAMLAEQPKLALTALPPTLVKLAPNSSPKILELQARAQLALDQILESVATRIRLDAELTDLSIQRNNNLAIWEALEKTSSEQIEFWTQQNLDPRLRGWLTLAYISKTSPPELDALKQQLESWQQQYVGHPARATAFPLILKDWQALQLKPERIAVILSLSGKYSAISTAIMSGILTAYYTDNTSDKKPVIQIYDLGDKPQNVQNIYAHAVNEGAEIIIGPLHKQAVARLSQMPELPIPVLSLNYADKKLDSPANLYQFGLLPEHEATQVADRSSWDGYTQAIAFVPKGVWGNRLLEAFRERFELLGGKVIATEHYEPRSTDFSALIKRALLLNQSENRYHSLTNLLQRDIKFEPSRRPDADMVFLAASPRQARLLRPQFDFHYASDLPVYATSHIYAGLGNPSVDRDLNQVIYCDMPWTLGTENPEPELHNKIDKLFPNESRRLPRLTALGIDAYRIIPNLKRLAARPDEYYSGLTGNLSMNDSRRIFRELKWARFVNGTPQVLNDFTATNTLSR